MAVMRRSLSVLAVALAAVATVSAQSAAGRTSVEAAAKMEVVDGDLSGAIDSTSGSCATPDRAVAATALVRMAERYQKLGDAEAQTIYRQVVRDFADQEEAAAWQRARSAPRRPPCRQKGERAVWTGPESTSAAAYLPTAGWSPLSSVRVV